MNLHHIVESQQFTLPMLRELFAEADRMERVVARGGTRDYDGAIMASLYYEPSTRTRFSFESAMLRLGGRTITTERAQEFSSVVMGETLEDTIRVVNNYADVIVLRHNEIGGAARAASVSDVPIINAGDGKGGQHPTQALLDLYTIQKELGAVDGVKVAFIGNLATGRTVRSLAYLLGKFERVKIHFIAPPELQVQGDILEYLERHGRPPGDRRPLCHAHPAGAPAGPRRRAEGRVPVVHHRRYEPGAPAPALAHHAPPPAPQ
jgi:aspartate carbamoyltransferase catalytic subunit